MAKSFISPGLGIALTDERRAAMQREARQKQELYAQQKKIQFSNLLERSTEDVDAYIESQNNVFLSGNRREGNVGESDVDSYSSDASPVETTAANDDVQSSNVVYDASDEEDGVDYFARQAFKETRGDYRTNATFNGEDLAFDPEAPSSQTLREHLLEQLELDAKYEDLDFNLKKLCRLIIDNLDTSGYLKIDLDNMSNERRRLLLGDAVAYPDYDEKTSLAIDELDNFFQKEFSRDARARAKKALADYYSVDATSKSSRRLAREEFDSIIGRKTTKEERDAARRILENIETKQEGDPLDALFPTTPSAEERRQAEQALKIVQSMDPPGVGARDLRESLLLRLRPDARYASQLRELIAEHFDDFIKKRIGALATKTAISHNELMQIYAAPFPFYPSPDELFINRNTPAKWIQPEIVVDVNSSGRLTARLDSAREDLELDPYYRKLLFSKRVDKKTKEYLRRQFVEAQALLDALRNRNSTLLRVAKAVVDFQEDFFVNIGAFPKPLTQQQIADKLGLDSSTVSRACNDKWLATPRGFISFKDLFPKAVVGEATSSNVAEKIRSTISQEDKSKPLSDEELAAELLKRFGVEVSRKTVQEHRDRLRIPNSRARKRLASQSEK